MSAAGRGCRLRRSSSDWSADWSNDSSDTSTESAEDNDNHRDLESNTCNDFVIASSCRHSFDRSINRLSNELCIRWKIIAQRNIILFAIYYQYYYLQTRFNELFKRNHAILVDVEFLKNHIGLIFGFSTSAALLNIKYTNKCYTRLKFYRYTYNTNIWNKKKQRQKINVPYG